jgi:hypothetical protein
MDKRKECEWPKVRELSLPILSAEGAAFNSHGEAVDRAQDEN